MNATQETEIQVYSPKHQALARHLGVDECDLNEGDGVTDEAYEYGREEWLVLSDSEADERAAEHIRESLWAFKADFISYYMPQGVDSEVVECLQEKMSEGCNEALFSMLGDNYDAFVNAAISSDGRGHFVSQYDGEEYEVSLGGQTFYCYRVN